MKIVDRKYLVKQLDDSLAAVLPELEKRLKVIASGTAVAERKGELLVPDADFALACRRECIAGLEYSVVEVSLEQALKFLSREAVVLPEAPRGYLLLEYRGFGLGFVKNLGKRTNSLLPAVRRIKKLFKFY